MGCDSSTMATPTVSIPRVLPGDVSRGAPNPRVTAREATPKPPDPSRPRSPARERTTPRAHRPRVRRTTSRRVVRRLPRHVLVRLREPGVHPGSPPRRRRRRQRPVGRIRRAMTRGIAPGTGPPRRAGSPRASRTPGDRVRPARTGREGPAVPVPNVPLQTPSTAPPTTRRAARPTSSRPSAR